MGVEIIEHQTNAGGVGIRDIGQFADAFGPVLPGPSGCDSDMTPSAQRFATPKLVAHPFALIFIVLAGSPPHAQRQGRSDLANQLRLFRTFGEAGLRVTSGIYTCDALLYRI